MRVNDRLIRDLAAILKEAARREILPRFRRLGEDEVRTKTSAIDLVTDADVKAEALITRGLAALMPGAVVVGEEATSTDPTILDRLADADWAVLVDPVDGTANFAAGLPLFGVMAAIVRRGEIVAAVIHEPLTDVVAYGLRGEGAWWEAADGRRTTMRVAPPVPVPEMSGVASWHWANPDIRSRIVQNLIKVRASFCYRCCAHEYRLAATGDIHFALFTKLMPWDHAPGWLLHHEAGGYSALLDGTPYAPTLRDGAILAAPDKASWEALRDVLVAEPGA